MKHSHSPLKSTGHNTGVIMPRSLGLQLWPARDQEGHRLNHARVRQIRRRQAQEDARARAHSTRRASEGSGAAWGLASRAWSSDSCLPGRQSEKDGGPSGRSSDRGRGRPEPPGAWGSLGLPSQAGFPPGRVAGPGTCWLLGLALPLWERLAVSFLGGDSEAVPRECLNVREWYT